MSKHIADLEQVLKLLVGEHEKLLAQLEFQQAAMKKLDLKAMDDASNQQEAIRMRIATLDQRRRAIVNQLALALKLEGQPTLGRLVEALPAPNRPALAALRERLKDLMTRVSTHAQVGARLAGAVLGHLNTAVRYIAGAVEQAGLYTKHGTPHVSQRIGMIEAVG